jgi:5'-deoxynucleotidase YfbR-like HD superfamily hydrolase
MSETKQPDWDKITEGKIRHGFAVAAFTNGIDMTEKVCTDIECWVRYVVDGKYVTNDKVESNNEVEEKTDAEYISEIIKERTSVLNDSDKDKVIKSLDDGHITKENLDVCLRRIEELAKNNESI